MYSRYTQFAALAAAGMLLSGCVTQVPVHEAFPVPARDSVASTEVVAPIKQSEIYVFVPDSQIAAAGGGGLLLALVDVGVNSVRTSKAEDAVRPLRDAIVDFNFDDTLKSELKTSLSSDGWLHVGDVRVIKEATPDSQEAALNNAKASAVLLTTTDYQLSNDAQELTITLNAALYANNEALGALKPRKKGPRAFLGNSLYHNTLTFTMMAPNATADRDHNIGIWGADKGAMARAALKMGARKLAIMLASDLQGEDDTALHGDTDGGVERMGDGRLHFTGHAP
jgi:hypothetical protein